MSARENGWFWPGLAGMAAVLVGHGIGRFAFVALLPGVVMSEWFTEAAAGYLQSSTLLGYLVGGFTAHRVSERIGSHRVIRFSMLAVAAAYLSCFSPFSYTWFLIARFVVGLAGAWLIIVCPAFIFNRTQVQYKSKISGMIFAGIGVGTVLSGIIVPALMGFDLGTTWVGLGLAALGFTLVTWFYWRPDTLQAEQAAQTESDTDFQLWQDRQVGWAVVLLLFAYALDATGYLPHSIYWVNFIVHELDMSIAEGSFYWSLFGAGAIVGPFLMTRIADAIGTNMTLTLAFVAKAFAVFLPDFSHAHWSLVLSSLLVGGLTTSTVALFSTVALEVVGKSHHKQVWGWMTTAFALAQAAMGYAMVYLFNMTMDYSVLFYVGGGALMLAALLSAYVQRLLAAHRAAGAAL